MRYFALTYITMPDDCGDAETLGDLVGAAARNAKAISEAIEREENRVAVEKERIRKAVAKKQEEADARQRPQQGPKRATEIKMSDHDDGVHVKIGSLTIYERPDDGPMKHGRRAIIKDATTGKKLTGAQAFYRLYLEMVKLSEAAEKSEARKPKKGASA